MRIAFYSKFAAFSNFQRFFLEKIIFFSKKEQILNVMRNLTISNAFFGKFGTIWWNKIQFHERTSVTWTQLTKSGWKNIQFEMKISLSVCKQSGEK